MKINKIIKLKNNKYKICIDDKNIITYDEVILENDLLYKKNIDSNLYNKILIDTNYYDIYNKVVKYILKKRRSEKEIHIYLNKYNLTNTEVNKMVDKLKHLKLIDDLQYCKAYINDSLILRKNGVNKIKKELLNQGISSEIIDLELNSIDVNILNDKLEKLIIKKISMNKKYSNDYLKQKILNELVNLGYERDLILDIINKNLKYDNEILKKEFDKLYNKLKNKTNSIELENKLKSKLLQKGFKISDINSLIQQKTED